jgi:hypothetical protein
LIKKIMLAMAAAAMLVAVALPAFAQNLDFLSPDANATAANAAEQNAAQEQNASQEQCINVFNQENNQEANATINQENPVFSPATVNQEQNASNVAVGVSQENRDCVAVIEQEQELRQDLEQEALAAAAAALGEAGIALED